MKRTILFYKTEDGKCPVEDFLDSLPGKVVQKIAWVLEILEKQGMLPTTYFKKLVNSEIWECRIQQGSSIYRIFCFFRQRFNNNSYAWFYQENAKDAD